MIRWALRAAVLAALILGGQYKDYVKVGLVHRKPVLTHPLTHSLARSLAHSEII